jgi:N-acetylglutamate synthase-like GNAT family acetyltransferase
MNIHSAKGTDLPTVRALLETERLPASDLDERALDRFLIWRDDSGVAGVIGLELFGEVAFLRSLVVAAHARGNGAGAALTQAAEKLAVDSGVRDLYLLTLTAERFFSARGSSARHPGHDAVFRPVSVDRRADVETSSLIHRFGRGPLALARRGIPLEAQHGRRVGKVQAMQGHG